MPKPRALWLPSAIVALVCLAAGLVLFAFDPAHHAFYPVCTFYRTTGLLCPGCGSLRALHQLLHGHWRAALHDNLLLIASLPLAGWFILHSVVAGTRHQPWCPEIRPRWLWVALVVVILFGVLRNLPFAQRFWLAPLVPQ